MKKIFLSCFTLIGLAGTSVAQEVEVAPAATMQTESTKKRSATQTNLDAETMAIKLEESGLDKETAAQVIKIEQEFAEKKIKAQGDASTEDTRAAINRTLEQQRLKELEKVLGHDGLMKYNTDNTHKLKTEDMKPVKRQPAASKVKKN